MSTLPWQKKTEPTERASVDTSHITANATEYGTVFYIGYSTIFDTGYSTGLGIGYITGIATGCRAKLANEKKI